MYNLNSSVSD